MHRYLAFIFACVITMLLPACGASSGDAGEAVDDINGPEESEIIRLPVVVHVLYYNAETNITVEKITSQIQVLNEDYRKLNADYTQTPDAFLPLVADVGIEFELATLDPQGNVTNGITRTFTEVTGWDGRAFNADTPLEERPLYFTQLGGHDAWPADRYLNIWVANMSNRFGELALAGYANPVGSDSKIDGVVIEPRVFGLLAPLAEEHTLGRTATHEIGHWLNLIHIYAGNDSCESSDEVDDTPNAKSQYNDFPVYPQSSCDSVDITMNFMDYVNDAAMYMFTQGQKKRMRKVFEKGGGRHALYLNNVNRLGP